ncbi:MAG TPA: Gfo/Idh/MocA family oxidoreductase [Cellvibrionaceae bacterium]
MTKIRWGVLSTAKIAREYVIPAINASTLGEVIATSSRREGQAQAEAEKLGIPRYYDSYQALLDDPDIDAIYNPLPNHLHVPWSVKAIEAGKHVLLEKPAGLNAADLEPLMAAAARHPEVKVMEAFMYRFHPQWQTILKLCKDIGPIRHIQAMFSYNNRDADNIRNSAAMGGGALMDVGCYGISLARLVFGSEPLRAMGLLQKLDGYEVDCITSGLLEFADGLANFTCSTKTEPGQWADIRGENGCIRLSPPFNPTATNAVHINVKRHDVSEEIIIPATNQYGCMTDAFARAILDNKSVPTPLTDALENMLVIDALFKSAEENRWVNVSGH